MMIHKLHPQNSKGDDMREHGNFLDEEIKTVSARQAETYHL
jgi:hypothetical protein